MCPSVDRGTFVKKFLVNVNEHTVGVVIVKSEGEGKQSIFIDYIYIYTLSQKETPKS